MHRKWKRLCGAAPNPPMLYINEELLCKPDNILVSFADAQAFTQYSKLHTTASRIRI